MKKFILLLVGFLPVGAMAQVPGAPKTITRMPLFFEKVYLHTDRQQYAPGDDVWFQAYLVNGQNHFLTQNSTTLYVDLLTGRGEVLATETIRLQGGTGNGDFQLSSALPKGCYRLRAYTSWMLNFGKAFVFEKWIDVSDKEGKPTSLSLSDCKVDLQFFPEGGTLVENVPSRVAFKAVSSWGKSCEVQGAVVTPAGDTVVTFQSTHLGMGSFAFLPKEGETYRAVARSGRYSFTCPFPKPADKGFVMRVRDTDTANFTVEVASNQATVDADGGYDFLLTGNNRGKRFFTTQVTLTDTVISTSIPKNLFPEGISSLTLYSERMQPCAERLLYTEPRSTYQMAITTDHAAYKTRDSIRVTLKVTNNEQPVRALLSVSAVRGSSPASPGNLLSYLWLESEVKGTIEQAANYFDTTNTQRKQQMDLLLQTQGWRAFVWQRLADTSIVIRHSMEQGLNLAGKVREQLTDKPYANATVSLTVLGANKNSFLSAHTDSAGRFYFQGLDFYGKKKITVESKNADGKNAGWVLFDTAQVLKLPAYRASLPQLPVGEPTLQTALLEREMNSGRKFSISSDTLLLEELKIKAPRSTAEQQEAASSLYGIAEHDFTLTDDDRSYGELTAFIMSKVKYTTNMAPDNCSNPLTHILIGPLPDPDTKYFRPILVLNDRQLTYEQYRDSTTFHDNNGDCVDDGDEEREAELYAIPLKYIDRIMVFRRIANVSIGGLGIPCGYYVISVYTTPEYRHPEKEILHRQSIQMAGYHLTRTFYAPQYDTERGPRKDERTTLYWAPNLQTNAKGELSLRYFNSDRQGIMRIDVQGLGQNGEIISATTSYMVK